MNDTQSNIQPPTANQDSQLTNLSEKHNIKNISSKGFGKSKKIGIGLIAILLVVGVSLSLSSAMHQTNILEHASGPEPTTPPPPVLNPSAMGPQSSIGNWSNTIPAFLKGKLVFTVTDLVQSDKPSDSGNQSQEPTVTGNPNTTLPVQPTHIMPTQVQNNNQEGKTQQTLTALKLTITKVEVHIAYQGKPGDQGDQADKPSTTLGQNRHLTNNPSQQGQSVDHWETLNIVHPTTIDLVQLAKINSFSNLGLTSLAAGQYTEVRLYVKSATATFSNGTTENLTILGKDNIVRVIQPFTITANHTTTLTMDFDAKHSVSNAGSQYLLKPVVGRLIETHQE